jgi:hypothetical protein
VPDHDEQIVPAGGRPASVEQLAGDAHISHCSQRFEHEIDATGPVVCLASPPTLSSRYWRRRPGRRMAKGPWRHAPTGAAPRGSSSSASRGGLTRRMLAGDDRIVGVASGQRQSAYLPIDTYRPVTCRRRVHCASTTVCKPIRHCPAVRDIRAANRPLGRKSVTAARGRRARATIVQYCRRRPPLREARGVPSRGRRPWSF